MATFHVWFSQRHRIEQHWGFHPSAKTLHSIAGMKPQDSMPTSSLGIRSDQMRKRMDANQTHAGAWVHDEAL